MVAETDFSKTLILILSLVTNTVSFVAVVVLKWHSNLEKLAPDRMSEKPEFIVLSSKNSFLGQKKWILQVSTQMITFFFYASRQPLYFRMQPKYFMCTSHLVIERIFTNCFRGQDLIKLVLFSASSWTFLSKTGIFLTTSWAIENTMATSTVWASP